MFSVGIVLAKQVGNSEVAAVAVVKSTGEEYSQRSSVASSKEGIKAVQLKAAAGTKCLFHLSHRGQRVVRSHPSSSEDFIGKTCSQ